MDTYEAEGRNQNQGHACHVNGNVDGIVVVSAVLFDERGVSTRAREAFGEMRMEQGDRGSRTKMRCFSRSRDMAKVSSSRV